MSRGRPILRGKLRAGAARHRVLVLAAFPLSALVLGGCVDRDALRWQLRQFDRAHAARQTDAALRHARAALELDPDHAPAVEAHVSALVAAVGPARAGQHLLAEARAEPAALGRAYAHALAQTTQAQRGERSFADAEAAARALLARFPGHAPTHRLLAHALHGLGHTEAAVAALQRALASDPQRLETALEVLRMCAPNHLHLVKQAREAAAPPARETLRRGALRFFRNLLSRPELFQRLPSSVDARWRRVVSTLRVLRRTLQAAAGACTATEARAELARLANRTGRWPEARRQLESAIRECLAEGDQRGAAKRLAELSYSLFAHGDFSAALLSARRLAAAAREGKYLDLQYQALEISALALTDMARFPEALNALEDAMRLARSLDATGLQARTHELLGALHLATGRPKEAAANSQQAYRLYQRNRDQDAATRALIQLADGKSAAGDTIAALALYERGRAQTTGLNRAVLLNNLAQLYQERRDRIQALGALHEAVELLRQTENQLVTRFLAGTLVNLANAYLALDFPEQALAYQQQAQELMTRSGASVGERALALSGLSNALRFLGYPADALKNARAALSLSALGRNPQQVAVFQAQVALLLADIGRPAEARRLFERASANQARGGVTPNAMTTLYHLARLELERGQLDAARKRLRQLGLLQTRQEARRDGRVAYLRSLLLEKEGELGGALGACEQAADQLERERETLRAADFKTRFFATKAHIYQRLVDLTLRQAGDSPTEAALAAAFTAIERGRARSLLDLVDRTGASAVATGGAGPLTRKEQALRVQLTALQKRIVDAESVADPQIRQRRLDALLARRRRLLGDLDAAHAELAARSPLTPATDAPRISFERFRAEVLPRNATFASYIVGKDSSHLLVLTRERAAAYRLPIGEKALREHITAYRALLTSRELRRPRGFLRAGHELYRLLLGPVDPALLAGRDLIISPSGPLALLPFEALIAEADLDALRPTYLLERHAVSYVPSASVLAALTERTRKRPPAREGLVLLADPVYDLAAFRDGRPEGRVDGLDFSRGRARGPAGGAARLPDRAVSDASPPTTAPKPLGNAFAAQPRAAQSAPSGRNSRTMLDRLPGTAREAQRIAAIVPGPKTLLLRDHAREERIKGGALAGHRLVHLASHGLLGDGFQALALTLDPTSQEDGFLETREVHGLRLDAELVTLSACQTGEGRMIKGEGVVGLTHAFLSAGAPRTVVSLWSVGDDSTAELLTHLYQRLGPPGTPGVARALREAKLRLLRGGASPVSSLNAPSAPAHALPFNWAPFILVGLP